MKDFDLTKYSNAGDAVLAYFEQQAYTMMFDKMGVLSNSIHGLIVVCMVIAILIMGAFLIANKSTMTWEDFFKMLLIASVVSAITPHIYLSFIVKTVMEVSFNLVAFFNDSPNTNSVFASVNDSFSNVLSLGFGLIKSGGVTDLAPVLTGIIVCGIFLLAYAFFAVAMVFSSFMLSIVFLFGFMLIKLIIFKTWRPVFKTWVKSVLKFALVPVVASIMISMGSGLVSSAMRVIIKSRTLDLENPNVTDITSGYEFYIILISGAVMIYSLMKVIEITAELTGSVANDLGGATRGAVASTKVLMHGMSAIARK